MMKNKLTLTNVHDPSFEAKVMELCEISTKEMIEKFESEFIENGCPACESNERSLELVKWGLNYQRCCVCELVYVSPCPNDNARSWYIENSKGLKFWRENMPRDVINSRLPLHLDRFDFIKKGLERFSKGDQRLVLEVGAGNGEMAKILHQNNSFEEIILVEPQPLTVDIPNCKVIQANISDVKLSHLADVVLAFEVLEHINNPKKFLQDLRKVTVDGGLLIMSTPNVMGLEIDRLGDLSTAFMFDHVRLYCPNSIKYILSEAGWELILVDTPGLFDFEIIKSQFESGKINLELDPALRFICESDASIGEQFQTFLQDNHLSSHMKIIAQKRLSE